MAPQTPLTERDAEYMRAGGVGAVRIPVPWVLVQPTRAHVYSWGWLDPIVAAAARSGLRVLPFLYGTPPWLAPQPTTLPVGSERARQAWGAFLASAVERYGPRGTFWSEHGTVGPGPDYEPPIARLPIRTWQIWNEPNLQSAMNPVNPGNYAKLLELSASAIGAADPSAKVMFAGMPGYSGNVNAWDFLGRVYQTKGARNAFDLAALHPYARTVPQMLGEIKRFRATMQKHGDGHKPLWIAEIGWGSLPKDATAFGLTKGKKGQARILKHAFHALKKKRRSWHIKRVLWFNFRDPGGGNVKTCSFCSSAGLLEHDGTPKPAWSAFRSFTR
jgi:hypothetical protein